MTNYIHKLYPDSLRRLICLCLSLAITAQSSPVKAQENAPADRLRIEEVRCAGNGDVTCAFIREHLYLRSGDALDEEEVRNAELRLSALKIFDSVKIRLEKGAERGAVVVVIDIEETTPVTFESMLGTSYLPKIQSATLAGRVGHHNLFGQGKVAELGIQAAVPFAGEDVAEGLGFTFTYADPQLFGSSRYFAIASAGWTKSQHEDTDGNFGEFEAAHANVALGRRFGDFSYVLLELNHRPDSEWDYGWWTGDARFEQRRFQGRGTKATLIYGWSSEDDLHFPTLGSALQLAIRRDFGANAPDRYPLIRYRKTWELMGGYLSVKVGGEPAPEYRSTLDASQPLALTYARPIAPGVFIQRGRWYVEPGVANISNTPSGSARVGYGLKAGLRAETRQFGLVELYLLGVAESEQ